MDDLPEIHVHDPLTGAREAEPIYFSVPSRLDGDLWTASDDAGQEYLCQRIDRSSADRRTHFVTVADVDGSLRLRLQAPCDPASLTGPGIRELKPVEDDAAVRLDTGYFDLELCRGTAEGTGSSKWGLRHFSAIEEGRDLLPSGNNAIGGFYGPFFTPENGLVNPPEHVVAEVTAVERGPVLHHYRLSGAVPDGLLPELRGKTFTIDWRFTHGTPWFHRSYHVDPFQTVVNGRSVTDTITVGDEFEAGPGHLTFDRFQAYDATCYRAGDPYAQELQTVVERTLASVDGNQRLEEFRALLSGDLASAHWDLYWRLFSTWEAVLPPAKLRAALAQVMASAHVRADLNDRRWRFAQDGVRVAAEHDQTIFAGPASKSMESHSGSRRAMVWWTSRPSGAFQIVQRPQSGWTNWGTNAENECPALPVGVDIKTAYGTYAEDWKKVADQLETPLKVVPRTSSRNRLGCRAT